jgi:hypothetical protein
MKARHSPRWRRLTVIAQDPSVRDGKSILKAQVPVPYEEMGEGPCGYRVQVVDYDASSNTLMKPWQPPGSGKDPFEGSKDVELLSNPRFHQQNVYAIVMRTLSRFEHALGRRVSWSFGGHQLKVAPHAFSDANAFYSKEDEALYFGYFAAPGGGGKPRMVFSCLSHDVVAHETTHALLDGLRGRYTDPSSPDQAAFHEGFSDIVALLSIFSLREIVGALVRRGQRERKRVPGSWLTSKNLKEGTLFSLAKEMGQEMSQVRGQPLRRSTELKPRRGILNEEEFKEPHRRGEVLVAAVLGALIEVWADRVNGLAQAADGSLDLARVVEEGRLIADRLLTMCIRALDYCPPVHLKFSDYLSALVTADREINPDDSGYGFRKRVLRSFAGFGILPASMFTDSEPGVWGEPEMEKHGTIIYDRTHFESMQRDPDEVFRFVWENRKVLRLMEGAYTRVQSVRPCVRVGDDGFMLRETVVEYIQILRLMPKELKGFGFADPGPDLLPRDREVFLYGGGVLIFDEYGRLKFHIHNRLHSFNHQNERIHYLAKEGYFERQRPIRKPGAKLSAFGLLHLTRSLGGAMAGEGCGCLSATNHSHEQEDDEDETF